MVVGRRFDDGSDFHLFRGQQRHWAAVGEMWLAKAGTAEFRGAGGSAAARFARVSSSTPVSTTFLFQSSIPVLPFLTLCQNHHHHSTGATAC
jgi:hypothetical protein